MAKTQKKSGYGLEFYMDISRVKKGAEMGAVTTKKMRKTLRVWLSKEGGGLFNKSAAYDLKAYLQSTLLSGIEARGVYSPIHSKWKKRKESLGLRTEMGLATEQMANAIDVHRSGYSEHRVGFTGKDTVNRKIGSITDIGKYAYIFEKGSKKQDPRPWFGVTFLKWADEELPEIIDSTFGQELSREVKRLLDLSDKGGGLSSSDICDAASASISEMYTQGGEPGETSGFQFKDSGEGRYDRGRRTGQAKFKRKTPRGEFQDFDESFGSFITELGEVYDEIEKVWIDYDSYIKKKFGI